MKYEMIFGDEKLFDGAPLDSVCVERFINTELVSVYVHHRTIDALLNTLIEREAVSCASNRPDIAIRRIIKEPKRWTWEDKKAGRLPEVGAKCKDRSFLFKVINVTDKYVVIETMQSGDVYSLTHHSFMSSCDPIETPDEKAKRFRMEWCNKAAKQLKNLEYGSTLTSIYDALLSGELTMPSKDGE